MPNMQRKYQLLVEHQLASATNGAEPDAEGRSWTPRWRRSLNLSGSGKGMRAACVGAQKSTSVVTEGAMRGSVDGPIKALEKKRLTRYMVAIWPPSERDQLADSRGTLSTAGWFRPTHLRHEPDGLLLHHVLQPVHHLLHLRRVLERVRRDAIG